MPNDENTQQPVNQNPMNSSNTSTDAGNMDDFDLDFGSDVGSSLGNQNQTRTGMFLTPEEEAQKEELKNSGQPIPPVQNESGQGDSQIFGGSNSESSFDINALSGESTDLTTDDANTQDKFDDKIEDLISFDDDNDDSSNSGENDGSLMTNDGGENNQDDWLQQEDKKVEETFGSETVGVNPNIEVNKSPDSVAQNVEDIFSSNTSLDNENIVDQSGPIANNMGDNDLSGLGVGTDLSQSNSNYVPDEEEFSNMSNLLNSASTGQVDLNSSDVQSDNNIDSNDIIEDVDTNSTPNLPQDAGNLFGVDVNTTKENLINEENPQTNIENQENSAESSIQSNVIDDNMANNDVVSNDIVSNDVVSNDIVSNDVVSNDVVSNGVVSNDVVSNDVVNNDIGGNQQNLDGLIIQDITNNQENFVNQADLRSIGEQPVQYQENLAAQVESQIQGNSFDQANSDSQINAQNQEFTTNQVNEVNPVNPVEPVNSIEPVNSVNSVNPVVEGDSAGILGGVESGNVNNNVTNIGNQGGLSLDALLDQEIQNMHIENPVGNITNNVGQVNDAGQANSNQVQSVSPQETSTKKRKKQSGFMVMGIFLGVIVLLGGLGFIAIKMFPDKFENLFKGDVVVEYLVGNENNDNSNDQGLVDINQGGENLDNEVDLDAGEQQINGEIVENNDEGNNDDLTNEEGNDISDEGEDGEILDPNSLAGLLEDNNNSGSTVVSGVNNDIQGSGQDDNGALNEENTNSNDDVSGTGNAGEEFDPFSEINNVLGGNESETDKLNEYISQGNYYKELGIQNNDKKMEKYGEYVVVTATEELGKLEKGEEIDNTIFGKLDELLESLK